MAAASERSMRARAAASRWSRCSASPGSKESISKQYSAWPIASINVRTLRWCAMASTGLPARCESSTPCRRAATTRSTRASRSKSASSEASEAI